ncbi:MAG: hypothetical protein ACTHM1_00360 [Solirubrobacteraceae bacterium]
MSTVEVCLFDVSSEALVPVEQGSVIWVRTEVSEEPFEALRVSAARSRVALGLLERMLEYEGRSGRFVIEPLSGDCTLLKAFGELEPREQRRLYNDPGGRRFSAQVKRGQRRIQLRLATDDPLEKGSAGGPSEDSCADPATTVGEVVDEYGQSALVMYLLSEHYSHPLGELRSGLREAFARIERVREVAVELAANSPGPEDMDDRMRAFRVALARDLDTPMALRILFELLRAAEQRADRIGDSHLHEMLALLSLDDVLEDLPSL